MPTFQYQKGHENIIKIVSDARYKKMFLNYLGLETLSRNIKLLEGHLTILDLSHNLFKELPEILKSLTKLNNLDVSFNHITQIPHFIQEMPKLKYLDFGNNKIEEIPFFLTKMDEFEEIHLNHNKIKILPFYTGLIKTKYISFFSNPIINCDYTKSSTTNFSNCIDNANKMYYCYFNSKYYDIDIYFELFKVPPELIYIMLNFVKIKNLN